MGSRHKFIRCLVVSLTIIALPHISRADDLATQIQNFMPSATAVELAGQADSECLPAPIKQFEVRFFTKGPSTVYVDRQQGVSDNNQPTCNYNITVKDGPEGEYPLPYWQTTVPGPGKLFLNGYWQDQSPDRYDVSFLDHMHLIQSVKSQMIFYRLACLRGYGCSVHFTLGYFSDTSGGPIIMLDIQDAGLLTYQIDGSMLMLKGCEVAFGAPNFPRSCSGMHSVSLDFNTQVGQMAIVDPTPESEAFYHYLTEPKQ